MSTRQLVPTNGRRDSSSDHCNYGSINAAHSANLQDDIELDSDEPHSSNATLNASSRNKIAGGQSQNDNGDGSVGCATLGGGGSNRNLPAAAPCYQFEHSHYFKDGRRRIDYVLVYEDSTGRRYSLQDNDNFSGNFNDSMEDFGVACGDTKRKHALLRNRFVKNLRRAGLDMEEEVVQSGGKKLLLFIKLHATWPVLCHYAEELNMRAPLQAHPNPSFNWSAHILNLLNLPNPFQQNVPKKPLDYYTCPFRTSKLDRFLGSHDHENYFTPVQRIRVLHEILSTSVFGKKKKGEIGIERLIDENVFLSAFPLHDGPYDCKMKHKFLDPSEMNARMILYHYWAKWSCWYKYQPLDHIREYFGEKIAIYFAWLGFYTGWLLPASIVGLLVFFYGLLSMHSNRLAQEVCNSQGQYTMCPLCDERIGCKVWDLSDVCGYAQLAYLFDHPGTVFYAVFVSFWAVTFLEYWKRKCASLAHHWDCEGFQDEEQRPRPEFAARAPFLRRNPVTGVREPSFPARERHKRIAAGIGIIFLMMSLVIIFIVAVIIYRVLVSIPLFQNAVFRSQAQAIANVTGAVVNLCLIMAMSRVYENLAYRLTVWEMHRTQTEFDDQLTFKVFIFQFVNFYSSIFYIAFFKGRFVGYPGNYTHILRLRNEDCSAGGCLIELAQQLAVIMIGKQIINNLQEVLVPKIRAWWHRKSSRLVNTGDSKPMWQQDYQLIDSDGLFQEYLEMVLQFGFITIFVAAFPLAPLFALLNNWVELRLDAQKFVCQTRRVVPDRAENIGIWFKILSMLAHLAVISNGFLIAFTSEFLPKLLYQYEIHWDLKGYVNFTLSWAPNGTLSEPCRYRGLRDEHGNHTPFFWRLLAVRLAFVIVFEHVVFGVCRLIDILVPDIPESLELKIKRERYLAKQALQDSDTILKVAARKESDCWSENNDPKPEIQLPGKGDPSTGRGMVLDLTAELGTLTLSNDQSQCKNSSQQLSECTQTSPFIDCIKNSPSKTGHTP